MITVASEEVVRIWCDVCGNEVTNSNHYGNWDKHFCMSTYHKVLDRRVSCFDFHKIKLQIESADIGF